VNKYQKYNQSELGKLRRREYRARTGKHTTSKQYKNKPFIAVGGLAIREPDGALTYVRVQLSTGDFIQNLDGLTSGEIFTFITSNTPATKDAILVSYGSVFDWNNYLVDIPHEQIKELYASNYRSKPINYGLWRLRLNRGQSFTIYDMWGQTRTINEIYNFFQLPLNVAIQEYLGETMLGGSKYDKAVTRENLKLGIQDLTRELNLTVNLITEFRDRLDRINLRPRRWNGSGGITSNLFNRHDIKNHMAEHPADIARIIRYAYAGGRFEMVLYGQQTKTNSYSYDINSAYPEALTKLPSLAGGRWHSIAGDPGYAEYALYKIKVTGKKAHLPQPLFSRDYNGSIVYPRIVSGWYWTPEIEAVRKWSEKGFGKYEIEEALVFEPATEVKPFAWIQDLYNERLKLQQAGDNAEVGIKLALNTAYGKLAQQIGFIPADGENPEIIPPYHQLDYAGYVTSFTRAKIFEAALEQLHLVIAFETDALYVQTELYNLPIGEQLGEYRETVYTSLTYLNSGVYYGTKSTGETVFKMRGIQLGTIDLNTIDKRLDLAEENRSIDIHQKRFIAGAQIVQMNSKDLHLSWRDEIINIKLYPIGKRVHYLCSCQMFPDKPLIRDAWHMTIPAKGQTKQYEYSVAWINPEPAQLITRQSRQLDAETLI
jgi:hypothetical protein